jgi:hypothetical protein
MRARGKAFTSIVAVLTVSAVAVLALAVGSAPAGNRNPDIVFDDFPGPDEVTFGQNVAYTASLENTGGSMFTHVVFRMNKPSTKVNGQTLYAELLYASCEPNGPPFAGLTATGYQCPEIAQVPSGSDPVVNRLVWRTPSTSASGLSCANPVVTDCVLTATGAWAIKENQPGSNDTFPVAESTDLLLQPNPTKSGGYALTTVAPGACSTASANLVTNLAVDASNKIATAVCASTKPVGDTLNPGLVIEIDEGVTPYGAGFTEMSSICIPNPGLSCPVSDDDTWTFSPAATHIFKVPEIGFPKGEKLDLAFHNGQPHAGCSFVKENKTKIWTVTCPAAKNGDWRFG